MGFRLKDTKTTIKILGIYQLVGGFVGLGIVGWLLLRTNEINGPVFLIFGIAIGLYVFSIKAGSLLLQKGNVKLGIIYSMIHQAVQVISISTGDYGYKYFSGANFSLGFEFTNGIAFKFGFGLSEFNIIDHLPFLIFII
jgi:hypothetical protein